MAQARVNITTEGLLTSPRGFGLKTASPCQRAAAKVTDGRRLGALADDPQVVSMAGGAAAIAALPDSAPRELYIISAVRCAKTFLACAKCIVMSQTVDLTGLRPGETPRISLCSERLDLTDVPYKYLVEGIKASTVLRPLLLEEPKNSQLLLKHPSGKPVQISCVAGSEAGAALIARWSAGVVFDEAPRMHGTERVTNLVHARRAVLSRLLPGAQIIYIGSPWAPLGPVYDAVQEFWGKPSADVVVLRATGPMLNPGYWTPERCRELQRTDSVSYQTDVLGEFADQESGMFAAARLRQYSRAEPERLTVTPHGRYAAAIDPSSGASGANPWTLVIVELIEGEPDADGEPRDKFRVAHHREWRGERPKDILREVAADCAAYGVHLAYTDQYAGTANADLAAEYDLALEVEPTTARNKLQDFTDLATLVATGSIELPPWGQLQSDLISVRKRITQTGATIVLPQTADGRHCDFAPALASAVKHARDCVSDSISAFEPPPQKQVNMPSDFYGFSQTGGGSRWDGCMGRGF